MKQILKQTLAGIMLALPLPLLAQTDEPVATGNYSPSWNSLAQWSCPEWFANAKFGIWAHWGPQCEAADGDWYARGMYETGSEQNQWHIAHYGDPKEFGLKDLCNAWKAQSWDPEHLIELYKSVGARYFFTLGNHHDNFDLWNSPYQEWNSVNVGPKRDIVKGWADACKKYGLPLGVSIHASHVWTFLEPAQDYDGKVTKADGVGKWWEGLDPQNLYHQDHEKSTNGLQWDWNNGSSIPTTDFMMNVQNRVLELVNDYDPQMLYFDDTVLPFYQVDQTYGLNMLTHFYNHSASQNGGQQSVVAMGKKLNDVQKQGMLLDVERGIPNAALSEHWQTCTCLGQWHYSQSVYDGDKYKSAATVVRMLVDIVAKNGNLLLSVPVKGDGTIDDKEEAILAGIKAWMDVNGRSIYDTKTWKTFGEGPTADLAKTNSGETSEGGNYSASDVRYVVKGDTVYATVMQWPDEPDVTLSSFGIMSPYYNGTVKSVEVLGCGEAEFFQDSEGLTVTMPSEHADTIAPVLAITFDGGGITVDDVQSFASMLSSVISQYEQQANYNTGKYNKTALDKLQAEVDAANALSDEATQDDIDAMFKALQTAYTNFQNTGRNAGGTPDMAGATDITADKLNESGPFQPTTETAMNDRFAKPFYWTVENFNIPQGGTQGAKQGLDHNPGYWTLYLGLWDDRSANTEGSLTNSRIYQTVHLPAGRYFFGAKYQNNYNVSNRAWVFASTKPLASDNLEEQSLAFYAINAASANDNYYGINFTLDEEQDVCLGFQMDLNNGSEEQEIRVSNVQLLEYGDIPFSELSSLTEEVGTLLQGARVNDNTGFYKSTYVEALKAAYDEACQVNQYAGYEAINSAYSTLKTAYNDFKANGMNKGGAPDTEATYTDITVEKLKETSAFSATDDTKGNDRFAKPLYWTVDNFDVAQDGTQGNKQGLDLYSNDYNLYLGLWGDRSKALVNLNDSRIYQRVALTKGRYYFGASFQNTWGVDKGYVFAADEPLETKNIEQQSLAWLQISGLPTNEWQGIFFTLDKDQEVCLGFQLDLQNYSEYGEMRVQRVQLLSYGNTSGIEDLTTSTRQAAADGIYTLSGMRVGSKPQPGIYVVRSGGKSLKVVVR